MQLLSNKGIWQQIFLLFVDRSKAQEGVRISESGLAVCLQKSSVTKYELCTRYKELHQALGAWKGVAQNMHISQLMTKHV